MKKILIGLLCVQGLYAQIAVFGDKYFITTDDDSLEIIYPKEYTDKAVATKSIEKEILKRYEKSYGFELDDTLYLGLLSSNNQIANAFSTQFPLNMQMNYVGGAYLVDFMSTTSWLKTLLLHESAHNFQFNPKKNPLSKVAHKIVKNTPFTSLLFMPIFPVPNILESNFLAEGNAVFNESRFGNGGRLYNGGHLAMTITQAKAGFITPKRTFNDHLFFPYRAHNYIVGGFFQLFLAQKYGTDKVNEYFWNHSGQFIPIQTNYVFTKTFGQSYEREIRLYSNWLKKKYEGFSVSSGEVIAKSKLYAKLNNTKDEIFFLTSDALSSPKLHVISKSDFSHTKERGNYLFGEVFKIGKSYYTSSSNSIDVNKIEMGLFDKKGRVLKESRSKIIQGILSDGNFVYFDVRRSFDQPQLYVRDKFYDSVNSSIFCDEEDNIYYFKQEAKKRTLYKNKKPLLSFNGWYGFVVDVSEKGVMFIANSKNGTTLYLYDGTLSRLSSGDDIIDAKLLDQDSLLITVIRADGFEYLKTSIQKSVASVYERSYFFEDEGDFLFDYEDLSSSFKSKPYISYKNLHFSNLDYSSVFTDDSFDFYVGANFSDALGQNSAKVFVSNFDKKRVIGGGYSNLVYRLKYGVDVYGVLDDAEDKSTQNFGANLFMNYPFYKEGYTTIDGDISYHIDEDRDEKEPLGVSLNYTNRKQFANSMYPNSYNTFSLFSTIESNDKIVGLKYNNFYALGYEFYASLGAKYAKSNPKNIGKRYGIEIDSSTFSYSYDPAHFSMPTLKGTIYTKEAFKGSLSMYKVLNFNAYYFTMPLSLRRESIYFKYNYYDITSLNDYRASLSEYIFGVKLDLIAFNKISLPLVFEYMQNDDLKDPARFRVLFDLPL